MPGIVLVLEDFGKMQNADSDLKRADLKAGFVQVVGRLLEDDKRGGRLLGGLVHDSLVISASLRCCFSLRIAEDSRNIREFVGS